MTFFLGVNRIHVWSHDSWQFPAHAGTQWPPLDSDNKRDTGLARNGHLLIQITRETWNVLSCTQQVQALIIRYLPTLAGGGLLIRATDKSDRLGDSRPTDRMVANGDRSRRCDWRRGLCVASGASGAEWLPQGRVLTVPSRAASHTFVLLASCRCSPTPCSVVTPPQRWLSGTPSALGRSVADGSSLSRQADSRPRTPIRRACPRPTSPLALVHRLGTRTGLPLEIGPAPPSQWELGSQGCSGDSSMAGWLGGGPARVGRSDRLGCWGFSPAGQGLAGIIIQNFRRRATLPFLARAAQDMHIQVARKYHATWFMSERSLMRICQDYYASGAGRGGCPMELRVTCSIVRTLLLGFISFLVYVSCFDRPRVGRNLEQCYWRPSSRMPRTTVTHGRRRTSTAAHWSTFARAMLPTAALGRFVIHLRVDSAFFFRPLLNKNQLDVNITF